MLNYMVEKETNNKYTCAYCGKGLRIIEGNWPHWVRLDYDPKRNLCSKSCVDKYVKLFNKFKMSISYKTIYNYIDKVELFIDIDDLVYGNYQKRNKQKQKT